MSSKYQLPGMSWICWMRYKAVKSVKMFLRILKMYKMYKKRGYLLSKQSESIIFYTPLEFLLLLTFLPLNKTAQPPLTTMTGLGYALLLTTVQHWYKDLEYVRECSYVLHDHVSLFTSKEVFKYYISMFPFLLVRKCSSIT